MNSPRTTPRFVVLAMALALAACNVDRATVSQPLGDISFSTRLVPDGRNLPNGFVSTNENEDSLFIEIAGTESLATGAYQVWLGARTGVGAGSYVPATGDLNVITIDTTGVDDASGEPITSVTVQHSVGSTFVRGGPQTHVELSVPITALGSARNLVFVTMEPTTTGSATPTLTGPRPLWADIPNPITFDDFVPFSFGTFDPNPANQYVFQVAGRGVAAFRAGVLMIADSSLSRPPVGYYYAAALIKRDAAGLATDTLLLGAQTAPYPRRSVSLRDADVNQVDPVVTTTPPAILAAGNRLVASEAGLSGAKPFDGFADLVITLEAKQGDEQKLSPSLVLSAPVPSGVQVAAP